MFLLVSDVFKPFSDLASAFPLITLLKFRTLAFILSNMDLLILPSLFLAGFSKRTLW